ncbi:MAG: hypothetical protein NT069_22340 [Planctomycetota bacterium]|nr:hypothetical protein [Planctomycetota bacterium]
MPTIQRALMVLGIAFVFSVDSASAALMTFVNAPSSNSSNWGKFVASNHGVVNTNIDFEKPSIPVDQQLNPNAYLASDGVTLTTVGFGSAQSVGDVVFNAGPSGGNTSGAIPGEGVYSPSKYLLKNSAGTGRLTISFNNPVMAVGFFIIDLFRRTDETEVTIEAFTGANGTGSSLGKVAGLHNNFQTNNIYFMGVSSTANEIGSLVFTDPGAGASGTDRIGIDNIEFAINSTPPVVPEPSSASLAVLGAFSVAVAAWQRQRHLKRSRVKAG